MRNSFVGRAWIRGTHQMIDHIHPRQQAVKILLHRKLRHGKMHARQLHLL